MVSFEVRGGQRFLMGSLEEAGLELSGLGDWLGSGEVFLSPAVISWLERLFIALVTIGDSSSVDSDMVMVLQMTG
eukprot:9572319-Ditylum_brightwellii.AAC.1